MNNFMDSFLFGLEKIAAEGGVNADETVYAPSRKRDLPIDYLKHVAYSTAGGLAGSLLTGGKRGGLELGALGGAVFSRLRNRKRMKRRLQEQGLDDKTVKKLEDRGMFESRPMDVVPIYGRMMAAKDIRQGLQDSGKRSRGHGFGVFTEPYKSA